MADYAALDGRLLPTIAYCRLLPTDDYCRVPRLESLSDDSYPLYISMNWHSHPKMLNGVYIVEARYYTMSSEICSLLMYGKYRKM